MPQHGWSPKVRCQALKTTYCTIPITWNYQERHIYKDSKQNCSSLGLVVGPVHELEVLEVPYEIMELF